eukprot:COSAG02_NODE_217_length_28595_cov_19.642371_7_plen_288_part_00
MNSNSYQYSLLSLVRAAVGLRPLGWKVKVVAEVKRTPCSQTTPSFRMGFPWANAGDPYQGQSGFAAARQSRANSVVARTAARAESLSNEISDLRGSRQRAVESYGEYELADIKWRASNIKAGRRSVSTTSANRARHPNGPAAPLQRMSHSDAQARENHNGPCGGKLDRARRHQQAQQAQHAQAQEQRRWHEQPEQPLRRPHPTRGGKLPQFNAFRSHTADPDVSERHDLDDSRRRERRDRRTRRDAGGGGRRRTIGGADDARRIAEQHTGRVRPLRREAVLPILALC